MRHGASILGLDRRFLWHELFGGDCRTHPETMNNKEFVEMRFPELLRKFHRDECGQDVLEYAMVLAAVLGAVVAGSDSLSKTLSHEFKRVTDDVKSLKIR